MVPVSAEEENRLGIEETKADVFIHGANAVSLDGEIIIGDYIGNRVVGSSPGSRMLIFVIGVNKICRDLIKGYKRAKNFAAKVNALRLGLKDSDEISVF